MIALIVNVLDADTASVLGQGFTPGTLMLLGVGLAGLGVWGRKKIGRGTAVDGRYLALGGRKVNSRGTLLFYGQEERRKKMKKLMIVLTVLFVFSMSAFAQMSTGQGGGMMGGGWVWGMNSGWFYMIILAIIVVLGIVYMKKRR